MRARRLPDDNSTGELIYDVRRFLAHYHELERENLELSDALDDERRAHAITRDERDRAERLVGVLEGLLDAARAGIPTKSPIELSLGSERKTLPVDSNRQPRPSMRRTIEVG
jgi:hypothetical protein